jgi:hypothetical protein
MAFGIVDSLRLGPRALEDFISMHLFRSSALLEWFMVEHVVRSRAVDPCLHSLRFSVDFTGLLYLYQFKSVL